MKYWKIGMLALAGVLVFGIAVSSPVAADSPVVTVKGVQDEVVTYVTDGMVSHRAVMKNGVIKKLRVAQQHLRAAAHETKLDAPANDDCANAESVTGPYPVTRYGDTTEATVDCPGLLDWNAVWYEVSLPYASNVFSVQTCGEGIDLDGVGVIWMDDCACDDYVLYTLSEWATCTNGWGGQTSYYANVPGPVTILYPVFATSDYYGDPQPGMPFSVTFNVDDDVPPTGACCIAEVCTDTTTEGACAGDWYIGETCPAFTCPEEGVADYTFTAPFSHSGDTTSMGDDCWPDSQYNTSPEATYEVIIPTAGMWNFELCNSSFDTWMAVGTSLCGEEVGYNDDGCYAKAAQSSLGPVSLAAGTYYVDVEGYYSGSGGPYTLDVFSEEDCIVTCPGGADVDPEPDCYTDYVDTTNGGCNSSPEVFGSITPGTPLCGTAGTYLYYGSSYRDTDWFEFTTTVASEVIVTLDDGDGDGSEFPVMLALFEPDTTCGAPVYEYVLAGDCEVSSLSRPCEAPGTYWVFVGPSVFTGIPCDADYVLTVNTVSCEATYCAASGGDMEYIERIQVGSIDNSTGYSAGGYGDYTALSTDMMPGGAYPMTLTIYSPWSSDSGEVWVDWNQDLDFDDAGEAMGMGWTGVGPYVGNVTVPGDALMGPTRMRVRMCWACTPAPCGAEYYGEVEDYTVNVIPPTGACCDQGGCTVTLETACAGDWMGPMVPCGPDCDSDGSPDVCDFFYGAQDCTGYYGTNPNGIPDHCDVDQCTLTCDHFNGGWCCDCQPDGIPDGCQMTDKSRYTYMYDTGVTDNLLGLNIAGELVWMHHFVAQLNAEKITEIHSAFGGVLYAGYSCLSGGEGVRLYVWSDPNGDGLPDDAVLLNESSGILNPMFIDTDMLQVFPVGPVTLTTGQSFFIGASIQGGLAAGCYPAPIDGTVLNGESWFAYGTAPAAFDPNNMIDLYVSGYGAWLLRAEGEALGPPPNDCNENGIPDECDCGDGIASACIPEECDDAGESADCDPDCTFPVCGDDYHNASAGEECDDGASNSDTAPNACRPSNCPGQGQECCLPWCGDGVTDAGEDCDDGGVDTATCDFDCTFAVCGDFYVSGYGAWLLRAEGEALGPPPNDCNENGIPDECDCGDGIASACIPEECDDAGESADCDPDCTFPVCGDDYHNASAGEECDDGASNSDTAPNACRPGNCPGAGQECCLPWCGDGVTDAGEDCDDGGVDTATCDFDCTFAVCGDFYVNAAAGEECDEGAVDTATCDFDCSFVVCGDMHVNTAAGEECEDGNTNVNDDCVTGSAIPAHNCQDAFCGDSYVWNMQSGTEVCDPAEATHGALCDQACAWEEGACCYETAGVCVDGVLPEDCPGDTQHGETPPRTASSHHIGLWCFEIECEKESIPTVSEWGLIVISLLLLTGIVIKFGRRQTAKS